MSEPSAERLIAYIEDVEHTICHEFHSPGGGRWWPECGDSDHDEGCALLAELREDGG